MNPVDSGNDCSGGPGQARWRYSRRLAGLRADMVFAIVDVVALLGSYGATAALLTGLHISRWQVLICLLGLGVHISFNTMLGLYGRVWRYAGIEEARQLLIAGVGTIAVLVGLSFLLNAPSEMRSFALVGPVLGTFLLGAVRFRSRLFAWNRPREVENRTRLALVGAGRPAIHLLRTLAADPSSGMQPVFVVDDDGGLRGRSLGSVPVLGTVEELPALCARNEINQIVVTADHPPADLMRHLADVATDIGIPLRVVPGAAELQHLPNTAAASLRKVNIEDLLGRPQVDIDLGAVGRLIEGKVVLLTGAGGSIGSEIARQVAALRPERLVMLDNDETHLFEAVHSIRAQGGDAADACCVEVLADIRESDVIDEIFAVHRPEVVFHAAAHKHVPMLEKYPLEALKTNVFGTENLLRAAEQHGVDRFVFISTDKAVRPANVLGASKRLGEMLVQARAGSGARYCAVRFGNVLGSRGSVVPLFEEQIRRGGPVTVTDPEMTRYFMSIPEAVRLVLQAAVFTVDNDLFMLNMGEPVRVRRLAEQMIRLSGADAARVQIEVVGARPGEKRHEELCQPEESTHETPHSEVTRLVSEHHVPDPRPWIGDLRSSVERHDDAGGRRLMYALVQSAHIPSEPPLSEPVSEPVAELAAEPVSEPHHSERRPLSQTVSGSASYDHVS